MALIFGYLGEGEPPALPGAGLLHCPRQSRVCVQGHLECNWLQAVEVGIDPAHASFLHRFFPRIHRRRLRQAIPRGLGRQRPADDEHPADRHASEIDVEPSDIGLRITALRDIGEGKMHVRVTNLLFPQAFVIPMSEDMTITQWHVPIDDASCYWLAIFTSFGAPVDKDTMRDSGWNSTRCPTTCRAWVASMTTASISTSRRARTYTGMGEDINVHDQWAVESQGTIQDRTREHLGLTDKASSPFEC